MSSISSGVDLTVKYQRLAVEYVKVRNQVSVLKSALLDEQSKRADLGKEIALKETRLFKLEGERDSLLFRNEQLLKRVEGLQESMDAQQATFGIAKGKKKHKEANLRLVAESSRMHRQALGGPSSSDPLLVLEGELERKINENSELHSKLFDVERRFDETMTSYTRRIDELEKENEAFKNANLVSSDAQQRNEFGICESENGATRQTLSTEANAKGGKSPSTANVPSIDSAEDILGCSHDFASDFANSQTLCDQTMYKKKKTDQENRKSSDLANSSNCENKSNGNAGDMAMSENYSAERISTLIKSLQHATGRATYYKQECEELLRRGICDQQRIGTLEQNVCELSSKCHSLDDALETTQFNYEAQLRHLHEHLAQNEERMMDKSERTLPFNGKGRDMENSGGKAKKSEKVRSNWFSPSSSSSSK